MKQTLHACALLALTTTALPAASTLVGDLRLPSGTYSDAVTYFDPASPVHATRGVSGAPVAVVSDFIAVSQNPGGAPDSATDIGIQTWSGSTTIRQLNRYAADPDGPGAAGGPQRAGAVQWTIDLSSIGGYLGTNNLDLTALDLRLVTSASDATRQYDLYLSYTNPAESITLTSLSAGTTGGDDNYDTFWWPAHNTTEGSVANGTHKVLKLDHLGDMDLTIDLLPLYDAGVTDLNLIMASGAFLSNRTIGILDGSGISIDTAVIPEPSGLLPAILAAVLPLARRRRG